MDLDQEWMSYLSNSLEYNSESVRSESYKNNHLNTPKCSELYISTKTIIGYLTSSIKLISSFWDIPILEYSTKENGVIKKQMKFNSSTHNEVDAIQEKCKSYCYVNEHMIQHIDNPNGRIKYKDIRKISIGLSKKDIVSFRLKQKSAFYNCFVIIIRIQVETKLFKEFHVKVFNTGKLELPGIRNDKELNLVYNMIETILCKTVDRKKTEIVLINSNFNCGFGIKREDLYKILKNNYNIAAVYDPCSYPGIQCKLYFDKENTILDQHMINKDSNYISFMIFRTGSVLIVGKCNEEMLLKAYNYLVYILNNEFTNINDINTIISVKNTVSKKMKKRSIYIYSS